VFIDVDNIGIGQDFADRIGEVLSKVDVVLVVIGMEWLDAHTSDGARRLDDPGDFVRIEVETALRRGILVVPVLVEGAEMPAAASLPEPMKPLARRNACVLDDRDWRHGVERLVHAIDDVIATGHFPAVSEPAAGHVPVDRGATPPQSGADARGVGASDATAVARERKPTPFRTRLRSHRRAIAAIAGVAMLLLAVLLWIMTRPGGGTTTESPTPAQLISSIRARVSETAPGAPFLPDCAQPPGAVRLMFPRQDCNRDPLPSNAFNTSRIFKVTIPDNSQAAAAWNASGTFQSQADGDGIYHSNDGTCTAVKKYGSLVYMTWWIKRAADGMCPVYVHDHQWQQINTALNAAVADGTG